MDDMQHSIQHATVINNIRCLIYMFNTYALEQLRLFTDVHTWRIDVGLVVVIIAWPTWQNEETACFHPFPQQASISNCTGLLPFFTPTRAWKVNKWQPCNKNTNGSFVSFSAAAEAFHVKYYARSNLYTWDKSRSPLSFPHTHWLLWKCHRAHQNPLLLWCVVAVPSKTPHYWLMEPHQLHSIKTQWQPHSAVSLGPSELHIAVTHGHRRPW